MGADIWLGYFKFFSYIVVRYFVVAGLFYFLLWKWFAAKLQRRALYPGKVKREQIKSEIIQSMKIAVAFMMGGIVLVFLKSQNIGMWYELNEKGIGYFFFSIFVMMVLGDTYFYWTHRLFHRPKVFAVAHRIHHKSVNPTPFTSMSFDVIESLVNVASVISFPFVLPINIKAYAVYTMVAFLYNVYAHCGYDLLPENAHQHPILKYFNSAKDHYLHHSRSQFNFGFYFNIWDRLMGTYRAPKDTRSALNNDSSEHHRPLYLTRLGKQEI